MNSKFDELVTRLESNQGSNLISVVVYGSAIAAPDHSKKSDYHVLIVTKRLSANELNKLRPIVKWWTSDGYSMPIFFKDNEIDESLDVYPIEFRHMKNAYRVLYGQDPLAGKEASDAYLRWQTEHELRGKLLRLRSVYLPAGSSARELRNLMTESVVSFVGFMRPVLELLGEKPPVSRLATVRRLGERLNIDTSSIVTVLELRKEPKELMAIEAQDLFASYLDCLERVIEAVDRL